MRKNRVLTVLCVAVLCLAGCFEVDQEFTLNPDGSGKVVQKVKRPDVMGQGEAGLASFLESQMTDAAGVDAWSDVSVEVTKDGSYLFTGTAYFSDFNELTLGDDDAFQFRWVPAGGGYRLELEETEETPTSGPPPSEAEAMASVEQMRTEWNQMKPMMQGIMGSVKWTTTFHLPANVTQSGSFEKTGPSTVRFEMTGDRYVSVIEEMMNDDALLEEQARLGNLDDMSPQSEEMPDVIMTKLFGEDGIYAVTGRATKPQFDYAAAVASAEAGFEAMMAALPVEAPKKIVPPAKGGDFRSLEVISTKFVTNEELAWQSEGAVLSIAGELPGSVIAVEEGELQSATSDNGTDLLPPEEWDRRISVSLDSEDPSRVKFDVKTGLPPKGAKGFREVAGVLYYQTATEPDAEIELFSSLEPGTSGSEYGAMLTEYSEGYSEGEEHVGVEINLPREQISEIVFLDAKGKPLDVSVVSTSWSSDSTSLTFSLEKGPFPRNGKAKLKMRQGMKTFSIPFKVTNVDLVGRPM